MSRVGTIAVGLLVVAALPQGRAEPPAPALAEEPVHAPQALTLPALEVLAKPPKLVTGGLELGVNGVQGNSELFKVHLGANGKYARERSVVTSELLYTFASAGWERKENRLLFKSRNERPLGDTAWSVFISGSAEYDEFKAYDGRLAAHTGFGYLFLDNPSIFLKGRLGAGGSREIGGPENRFMPEGLLGLEWEQTITKRQKLKTSLEFFPDLAQLGEFRSEGRVSYEVLIDPEWNLTLKLGLLDRYDSTPEGKRPNDLEYFAVLLWKF